MKKTSKRNPIMTIARFEKETGVHFTTKHTGKMEGMQSISTSCLCNPACIARMKDESSICSKCFSGAMMHRYSALSDCMVRNYEILNNRLFELDELPLINAAWFRIESFGDIGSVKQARNYIRLIRRNPQTMFAWWTKNPGFLAQAIALEGGKPDNVNIILSSPYLNVTMDACRWSFVDKTFTVWDKEHEDQAPVINCGSRRCMECRLCYTKNDVREIHESLK